MGNEKKTRSRTRGPSRRDAPITQIPWKQPKSRRPLIKVVSDDEISSIYQTSLKILEEIGINFHSAEACKIFKAAGAKVNSETGNVKLGREIVESALGTVQSSFQILSRNPERTITIGDDNIAFTNVLGPPNCSDIINGRRSGTLADMENFMRLAHKFNIIHMVAGSPVEANDIEVSIRHLEATRSSLKLSDKVPYVFAHSPQRIRDVLDMIAISHGLGGHEDISNAPRTFSIINSNSPLQYDGPMADGVIELAKHNQTAVITPFSLAGATMPIHLAGAVAMSNAEGLAGITLSQLVRPGAPVLSGAKTINVDMKTGAPFYSSPESNKSVQMGAQLARSLGIPFRAANFNMSNALDGMAMAEAQGSLWAGITAGASLFVHAAGWLEGGLCSSFEKFILDVEMLQMMSVYLEDIPVNDETLSIDEIKEVGPGGHFFGTDVTIANFESSFYNPIVASTQNYGAWEEAGAKQAPERAHELYQRALREYDQPRDIVEDGRSEKIDAFVDRRVSEGGAPID